MVSPSKVPQDAARDGAGAAPATGKAAGAQAGGKEAPADGRPNGTDGAGAEAAEDDATGGDGAGQAEKGGLFDTAKRRFQAQRDNVARSVQKSVGIDGDRDQRKKLPMERDRCWEMSLAIKSFTNLTKETVKFFFVVSVESDNPRRKSRVRIQPKFTSTYTVAKSETRTPFSPVVIFNKKEFKLSYKELERHHVKIDIWEISCWTFNTYLGYKTMKLSDVARRDPNIVMMLKRKLTRKSEQEQRQRGRTVADVAQVWVTISLEEIFDFTLECDNWTLEMNPQFPNYAKMQENYSRLTFIMPKNKKSLPDQNQLPNRNTSTTTEWIKKNEVGAFFWPNCGKYVFRGTRSHLINSYFMVFIATTSTIVNEKVEKFRPGMVGGTGGRCLLNLISVLQISVFQGRVKNFKLFDHDNPGSFVLGNLCGSIKAVVRSKALSFEETDLRVERPQQLALVANVANLNKDERHLVVKVKKCESLPAADTETGLSDPFLRVIWDSSSMTSTIMFQTVRPVFNTVFYFPVRLPKLTGRERRKEQDIMKCELKSRNLLKIEVWDDDNQTNADYLGGCAVKLNDVLKPRRKEKVNMLGTLKKAQDGEGDDDRDSADDDLYKKGGEWYEDIKEARVYDGTKMPLTGGSVYSNSQPTIHFEVFFYPDFGPSVHWTEDQDDEEDTRWPNVKTQWEKEAEAFAADYKSKFPDAIGARPPSCPLPATASDMRRFPIEGCNPLTMIEVPLMAFVCPIIIPEKFSFPAFLLHWVHCLTFDASLTQQRTGLIPTRGWKHTEFFLQRRKGAVQDHAVLLCSLLLGCKKDAFVCKGTWSDGGRSHEHAWVMTREEGWVTFWEPCTRQMYHLPNRYSKRSVKQVARKPTKKGSKLAASESEDALALPEDVEREEEEAEDESAAKKEVMQWEDEVEDARIAVDDMSSLPTIGRMPKPKMKADGKRKEKKGDIEREEMMQRRKGETVSANFKLLQPKSLVDWLPYDSLEIVFNDQNLWANWQNHHPACITYDLEGSDNEEQPQSSASAGKRKEEDKKPKGPKWRPLIQAGPDEKKLKDWVASCIISPNVSVQPRLNGIIVEGIRKDLLIEMQQNVELHRSRKGVDTNFDSGVDSPQLTEQLGKFLEIHEHWMMMDPDMPEVRNLLESQKPEWELQEESKPEDFILRILQPRRWNMKGSPFFDLDENRNESRNYQNDQKSRWEDLIDMIQKFQEKLPNFPTKRGKKFRGFPVHFNTTEADCIREYLMHDPTYVEMIDNEDEDTSYTIECKIFPLLGGVLSVWLYIGVQETVRDEF